MFYHLSHIQFYVKQHVRELFLLFDYYLNEQFITANF